MKAGYISLYAMVLLYALAGINHFINPNFYLAIMPKYFPFHLLLVYLSGVCEIVFALMLLKETWRKLAAYLIIAMLIVFLTVHIQMLMDFLNDPAKPLWIVIVRLPLQFVLIYWAYSVSKIKKAASI